MINYAKAEEYKLLKKINKKLLSLQGGENKNDIDSISSKLYKEYELSGFYVMAKSNKFDITSKISEWINTLFLLLEQTEHSFDNILYK